MLIASKYEEMYAPEVRDFVYITDNAYSSVEIRAMEQKMLRQLDFSFGNPLCLHFLRRDSRAGDVSCCVSVFTVWFYKHLFSAQEDMSAVCVNVSFILYMLCR